MTKETHSLPELGCLACADAPYVLAALTNLASFAKKNPKLLDRTVWSLVLAQDVPSDWLGPITAFAEENGVRLQILSEADIEMSAAPLRLTFGGSISGATVSRMAYARLYGTRYLIRTRMFSRIIYFDCDTLCIGSLSAFSSLSFEGRSLMAALDIGEDDIKLTASLNDLDPSEYVNSGILQFDCTIPITSIRLEHAIELSETQQDRLLFLDQCAINIAFKNAIKMLPSVYNRFVMANYLQSQTHLDASILHFLGQPKPWQAAYVHLDRKNPWRETAEAILKLFPDHDRGREMLVASGAPIST